GEFTICARTDVSRKSGSASLAVTMRRTSSRKRGSSGQAPSSQDARSSWGRARAPSNSVCASAFFSGLMLMFGALQFQSQPLLGKTPLGFHGGKTNLQIFGDLRIGQTTEASEHNDLRLAGTLEFHFFKTGVNHQQLLRGFLREPKT